MKSSLTIYIQELRFRFVYCFLGWSICLVVCTQFVDQLLFVLLRPYFLAQFKVFSKQDINQFIENQIVLEEYLNRDELSITNQLDLNLRFNLETVIEICRPIIKTQMYSLTGLLSTTIAEAFLASCHCCWFYSICLTWPIFLYSLWCFLVPGITEKKRRILTRFCLLVTGLFLCWQILLSRNFLPYLWVWFLSFDRTAGPLHTLYQAKMMESLELMITFLWWNAFFGTLMPVLIWIALQKQWLYSDLLIRLRGPAFVACILFSSILAPPDVLTQLILNVFFFICYEIILVFSFLWLLVVGT